MQRGFSLVELSIVLVILGLLTGGILAGQSLIRAAELRSVSADAQRYITALHGFRDKYFALPGDMATATKIWGAVDGDDGLGVDCYEVPSTTRLTCNGDGTGQIAYPSNFTYEMFLAWKHLANAGLIEGSYTGATVTAGADDASIGVNVPTSKIKNAAFSMRYWSCADNAECYGNVVTQMMFGRRSSNYHFRDVLKPEEAWNIDSKMDDGRPGLGKVRSWKRGGGYNPVCATTATAFDAQYDLALNAVACTLLFVTS